MPKSVAIMEVPAIRVIGEAYLNTDTAAGRTSALTCSGRARVRSASSSSTGRLAIDERVLNPTA